MGTKTNNTNGGSYNTRATSRKNHKESSNFEILVAPISGTTSEGGGREK
jgi:hypothetical protein